MENYIDLQLSSFIYQVSMEVLGCPPFCEVGCDTDHDKLLLALVNCTEENNEISAESQEMLLSVIKEKQVF